jgi:hypothetical protein
VPDADGLATFTEQTYYSDDQQHYWSMDRQFRNGPLLTVTLPGENGPRP